MKGYSEVEVWLHEFILRVLDGGEWSFLYRSHFNVVGIVPQRNGSFSVTFFELNNNSNGRTYIIKITLYQLFKYLFKVFKTYKHAADGQSDFNPLNTELNPICQ